jgi:glucose-6-phosphate 1-epimerase
LLHTYFSVDDISSATVGHLTGCEFQDSLLSHQRSKESRSLITIEKEVDRIYENVPNSLIVNDDIEITKIGFTDAVVWNPWIEKSKAMSDFDDDEYKKMLCVEMGCVAKEIVLNPNENWTGYQIISKK